MKTIDARGLSCPEPILRTQAAIKAGEFPFAVLVDSATQRDNVTRTAHKNGCEVEVAATEDGFSLQLSK